MYLYDILYAEGAAEPAICVNICTFVPVKQIKYKYYTYTIYTICRGAVRANDMCALATCVLKICTLYSERAGELQREMDAGVEERRRRMSAQLEEALDAAKRVAAERAAAAGEEAARQVLSLLAVLMLYWCSTLLVLY